MHPIHRASLNFNEDRRIIDPGIKSTFDLRSINIIVFVVHIYGATEWKYNEMKKIIRDMHVSVTESNHILKSNSEHA